MDYNNANDEARAAKLRKLAEDLRLGKDVSIGPSGEVMSQDEADDRGISGIKVPKGKLA